MPSERGPLSDAGRKGLPDRQQTARVEDPPARGHAHRFRRQRRAIGPRIRPATPSASPRHSARPATLPRASASAWPPKARFAGAACTAGETRCNCWRWWTGRRRSASRRTWRTRCCSRWATTRPKTACCPKTSTGAESDRLAEAYAQDGRRAAPLDDRLPRRPERRHGEGLRLARQDRPPLPAERSQRQARYRARFRRLAARRRRRSRPAPIQHICWDGCMFPNAVMLEPQDLERHAARHDRGARRARLELR